MSKRFAKPIKYDVGMPNPYTRGSEIHKLWEVTQKHPKEIRGYSDSGTHCMGISEEGFLHLRKVYALIGVDDSTWAELFPRVVLTQGKYAKGVTPYFYKFKIHLPKKHYARFKQLRVHCLNMQKQGVVDVNP